ncbi:hypothetical protein PUN28_014788 [Cardiocondyla obscurior]|uniref:Poly(A) RNA polymerase, mitochondrial n=1 Tax=Cardiocondyla obscurior TaxID=286306 RepID=A0AAW2EVF6_9HYME
MLPVSKIMSSASFGNKDNIVSVKSSILWFKKGQITSKKNIQKVIPLSVTNGCMPPTDKEVAKLMFDAKTLITFVHQTSGQIILLYEALKLTDLEIRLRFHAAQHLEQYFSGLFDNIRVLPFGSSINGFGRKRCDLDLVVVPDNAENDMTSRLIFHSKYMAHDNRLKTKEFLNILAMTMQNLIPGILNVRKILEARVPIIKFCYDYTQIECDLSATNMTAIYMTELLYLYGEIDWRVRPLVIAIRVWAKSQELTSNVPGQWITNFPLTLLVLFYLQQKKILPSLKTLKLYASRSDARYAESGGIDCTFLRDISKLPADYKYKLNQDNLETLLHGFFEYYSTFNFQTYGICIREGVKIRKPSRSPLHITNPLETTLNVCKNVNLYELDHIISKSHNALYTLETDDKSKSNSWGIMNILKLNNIMNVRKSNSTREQINEQLSENHSYVNTEKFEDSEVDEAKTKKKETA